MEQKWHEIMLYFLLEPARTNIFFLLYFLLLFYFFRYRFGLDVVSLKAVFLYILRWNRLTQAPTNVIFLQKARGTCCWKVRWWFFFVCCGSYYCSCVSGVSARLRESVSSKKVKVSLPQKKRLPSGSSNYPFSLVVCRSTWSTPLTVRHAFQKVLSLTYDEVWGVDYYWRALSSIPLRGPWRVFAPSTLSGTNLFSYLHNIWIVRVSYYVVMEFLVGSWNV